MPDAAYGWSHQAERARRIAAHQPGDPCSMGGEPLWQAADELHLAHDHVNGGYLAGLSCAYHNCADGADRSNRTRPLVLFALPQRYRCDVCGKTYRWKSRTCEICEAHYHPSYQDQRTCGRACGAELQRRNRPEPRPVYTEIRYFNCTHCGNLAVTRASDMRRKLCRSRDCRAAVSSRYRRAYYYRKMGATDQQAADLAAGNAVLHFTTVRPRWLPPKLKPRIRGSRYEWHRCPACGELTGNHRWCDSCRCITTNAKGNRCHHVATDGSLCAYHSAAVQLDGHSL